MVTTSGCKDDEENSTDESWVVVSFLISRHGYHYPPHGHWDFRDSHGYYNYYRGEHAQQGTLILRIKPASAHYALTNFTLCTLTNVNHSQRCSCDRYRRWPVGLTRLLVDGSPPRPTVPAGTFRELLQRGVQVGTENTHKMVVGVEYMFLLF